MIDDLRAMLRAGARRQHAALLVAGVVLMFAAACGSDSDVVIIAITATPETASPTATTAAETPLTPTAATTTATPEPSAEPPSRPDNLFGGANLLVAYLAGGADTAACLPALAVQWGLDRGTQLDCVETDLDGDGAAEFVLRVTDGGGATTPGDIWFYGSPDQGRRLLGSARSFGGSVLSGVLIVAAEDLTGDGLAEVVISSENCGVASCTTNFLIMSAHRGTLENLAPENVALEGSETPEVTDVTDDGLLDLVLRGGVVSSAGAGPPRPLVRSVYWSGLRFFVVDKAQAPRYLIHAIADADTTYAGTDYAAAGAQYLAIANNSTLSDWKLDTATGLGRNELAAYARFRAGLASQRLGAIEQSLTLFEGAYDDHPTALMGVASAVYLDQLQNGATAVAACAVTEQYLSARAAEFARIWDYGYANPEHTITGICR
jgi:hypothetical protein